MRFSQYFATTSGFLISMCLGFCLMSLEFVFKRMINPVFGSDLYTWSSLISTILLCTAAGTFFTCYYKVEFHKKWILGYFVLLILIVQLSPLYVNQLGHSVIALQLPFKVRLLLFTLTAVGPAFLFLGAILGIISTFNLFKNNYAMISLASTVGGVFGTISVPFIFTDFFQLDTYNIIKVLVFTLIVTSIILAILKQSWKSAILLSPLFFVSAGTQLKVIEPKGFHTKYQSSGSQFELRVIDFPCPAPNKSCLGLTYGSYSLMQTSIVNDPKDLIEVGYENSGLLSVLPQRKNMKILVLGFGAGLFTSKVQQLPGSDVSQIDIVDIEESLFSVSKNYFHYTSDSRSRFFTQDARSFLLQTLDREYDFIAVSIFGSAQIVEHVSTLEFFKLAKSKLSANGRLAVYHLGYIKRGNKFDPAFLARYKTFSTGFENDRINVLDLKQLNAGNDNSRIGSVVFYNESTDNDFLLKNESTVRSLNHNNLTMGQIRNTQIPVFGNDLDIATVYTDHLNTIHFLESNVVEKVLDFAVFPRYQVHWY